VEFKGWSNDQSNDLIIDVFYLSSLNTRIYLYCNLRKYIIILCIVDSWHVIKTIVNLDFSPQTGLSLQKSNNNIYYVLCIAYIMGI